MKLPEMPGHRLDPKLGVWMPGRKTAVSMTTDNVLLFGREGSAFEDVAGELTGTPFVRRCARHDNPRDPRGCVVQWLRWPNRKRQLVCAADYTLDTRIGALRLTQMKTE